MKRVLILALALLPLAVCMGQVTPSRYTKEIAFPLHMNNLSVGVSPALNSAFLIHPQQTASVNISFPVINLGYETSIWDLGRAGTFGFGGWFSYGRYRFTFDQSDGSAERSVTASAGNFNFAISLSYHYTLFTRAELYGRVMLGGVLSGFNYPDDRQDGWDGDFRLHAVLGVRYFVTHMLGIYLEGGRTPGWLNVGVTWRW